MVGDILYGSIIIAYLWNLDFDALNPTFCESAQMFV